MSDDDLPRRLFRRVVELPEERLARWPIFACIFVIGAILGAIVVGR